MRYSTPTWQRDNLDETELCMLCGGYECNCYLNTGELLPQLPTMSEQELKAYNKFSRRWGMHWTHKSVSENLVVDIYNKIHNNI